MKPLTNVLILDLTRVLAGPYATMLLADMGAEVIKIEEPQKGDDSRAWPPFISGESTYFLSVNRGKRSLTLNLKTEQGKDILRRIIERADVLVENFRPGVVKHLGIEYENVHAMNPRIVYCSISAFGESGPDATRPGYDIIIQAESGLMDLTGSPYEPPNMAGISIVDLAGGMTAVAGIAAALLERDRSGEGQKVEIALAEVMSSLLANQAQQYFATGASPRRQGNQHPAIVPYGMFAASDGYFVIGVANNTLWKKFCEAIGRPKLTADPRFYDPSMRVANREVLMGILTQIFFTATAAEWLRRFTRAGVPVGKVKNVHEAFESEHLKMRGSVITLAHPKVDRLRAVGSPIRLHTALTTNALPPPLLGEHTDGILRELGYSTENIMQLRAGRVI